MFVILNQHPKESEAKGTNKLLGDSLRKHPENVMENFTPGAMKAKLMTGSYATMHVRIIVYYF